MVLIFQVAHAITLEKSSIYRCAPDNSDEGQEQLDMVMKQSMLQDCPKTSTELRPTVIYQPIYSPAFGSFSALYPTFIPLFTT